VFDLDGTLSDPFEGIWRSVNFALATVAADPVPREAFPRYIGPPIDRTFRTLLPDVDDDGVHALVAAFRDRYGRLGYAENTLYDGVPEVLDALRSNAHPCGVCTAKRRDFAVRILEMFTLDHQFGFVDGGDVGVAKADQLAGLLKAGTIGTDAIMIGDRASDIAAAATNGLRAIGVTWGFGSREELADAGPREIANTPAALLGIVDRL
jgi:phosphoglycolate phosphatase